MFVQFQYSLFYDLICVEAMNKWLNVSIRSHYEKVLSSPGDLVWTDVAFRCL